MAGHHVFKNLAGHRAAKQIAWNAVIGSGIGLTFAMIYKIVIIDPTKKSIDQYYAAHPYK